MQNYYSSMVRFIPIYPTYFGILEKQKYIWKVKFKQDTMKECNTGKERNIPIYFTLLYGYKTRMK